MLNVGTEFPNYTVNTTLGTFKIHEYLGTSWGLICSHPADFTPVCTTEIARMAQLTKETEARNVKVMFLSCDPIDMHKDWVKDIEHYSGCKVTFPIIDDENNKLSSELGMFDASCDKFQTIRGVFIVDPSKKVRATICYPSSVGRNFDEVIRLIDALQLTSDNTEAVTPQGWCKGDKLLVKPGCEGTGAKVVDLPSGKPYLRFMDS
ncbi:Peroxiredoxin-6, partial [Fragariocoptes setiger]